LRTCFKDRYATDLERISTIGPRQRAKKKLVRRTGQNSLHNLTQKVAAQKDYLDCPSIYHIGCDDWLWTNSGLPTNESRVDNIKSTFLIY